MKIEPHLVCPNCGGTRFQQGPFGGNAMNIRCVCGYCLNVSPVLWGDGWLVEELGFDSTPIPRERSLALWQGGEG